MAGGVTLTGGQVLREGGLERADLTLTDGCVGGDGGRVLDVSGCLVLPAIVDVHGDGFERHLAPRRGAVTDPVEGLKATEAELLANGITTAVLAQFWSWEGGMRGPDFAERLATALAGFESVVDLRLQLRFEYPMHGDFGAVLDFVARHRTGYVVFNDHLPHDALTAGRRVPRLEGQAIKSGRSPEAHLALLEGLHAGMAEAEAALPDLADAFAALGVRLGSHDDPDPETRARWRSIGVGIAEFPTNGPAAEAARASGDPVILGAPNVLRGGSHKRGGVSARDMIEAGLCDALASDYHYPALFGAARRLLNEGWELEAAWRLISDGPARVLGLADRGRIDVGLRGDVIVTSPDLDRVEAVFAQGRPAFVGPRLAGRWFGGA